MLRVEDEEADGAAEDAGAVWSVVLLVELDEELGAAELLLGVVLVELELGVALVELELELALGAVAAF